MAWGQSTLSGIYWHLKLKRPSSCNSRWRSNFFAPQRQSEHRHFRRQSVPPLSDAANIRHVKRKPRSHRLRTEEQAACCRAQHFSFRSRVSQRSRRGQCCCCCFFQFSLETICLHSADRRPPSVVRAGSKPYASRFRCIERRPEKTELHRAQRPRRHRARFQAGKLCLINTRHFEYWFTRF